MGERWWATFFSTNQNLFFLIKKQGELRGEWRHQIEGVRGVKRGVDVTRADWPCVREGTPLRGECPVHSKLKTKVNLFMKFPQQLLSCNHRP
ncbi:hypothetical protein Hanom_Chr09g00830371 [Helianthus anomalus]